MTDYRIAGKKCMIERLGVINEIVAGLFNSCGAKPCEQLCYGACIGLQALPAPLSGGWTTCDENPLWRNAMS
jgi:hypothetical protein